MQDLLVGAGEREVDVVEPQPALRVLDHPRAGHDVRLGVEDLEDPGRRRHRLLRHCQDHSERRDRPHQREHQRDEGDQLTRCQLAAADAGRSSRRTTATARLGITSRNVQNFADSRTLSMLVAWSWRAATSYCPET